MSNDLNFKEKDILSAINNSAGIVSTIAKKMSCNWHTAKRYIDKYDSCIEALSDESEKVLDIAESALYNSIKEGNTQDAKWLLAVKGKKRGFNEKTEINLNIKEDNEFKIVKKENADS